MDKRICDKIFPELSSRAKSHGYNCIGLELVHEDEQNILRLYIENNAGTDLLGCEAVSRDISLYLDTVEDMLPPHYLLEVTSPGLERPLFTEQDFIDNIGQIAELTLTNKKTIVGDISDANQSLLKLSLGSEILEFEYNEIQAAHLVFSLTKGQKKIFKKNNKKKK